jgi:hypothetical protein
MWYCQGCLGRGRWLSGRQNHWKGPPSSSQSGKTGTHCCSSRVETVQEDSRQEGGVECGDEDVELPGLPGPWEVAERPAKPLEGSTKQLSVREKRYTLLQQQEQRRADSRQGGRTSNCCVPTLQQHCRSNTAEAPILLASRRHANKPSHGPITDM